MPEFIWSLSQGMWSLVILVGYCYQGDVHGVCGLRLMEKEKRLTCKRKIPRPQCLTTEDENVHHLSPISPIPSIKGLQYTTLRFVKSGPINSMTFLYQTINTINITELREDGEPCHNIDSYKPRIVHCRNYCI